MPIIFSILVYLIATLKLSSADIYLHNPRFAFLLSIINDESLKCGFKEVLITG
jgi:hypothetical protein